MIISTTSETCGVDFEYPREHFNVEILEVFSLTQKVKNDAGFSVYHVILNLQACKPAAAIPHQGTTSAT